MESVIDSEYSSIIALSQGIARLLDLKCPDSKFDKLIFQLQALCGGSARNELSKVYGSQLPAINCVLSILKLPSVVDSLKQNPEEGLRISKKLVQIEGALLHSTCLEFLSSIIPSIAIGVSSERLLPVLESLWKNSDFENYPIDLVECLLLDCYYLEEWLIHLYGKVVASEVCTGGIINCWNGKFQKCWIEWSAASQTVFMAISSSLNSLLVHAKRTDIVLSMIAQFVSSVKEMTARLGSNICDLYPIDLKHLVLILNESPDSIPEQDKLSVKLICEMFKMVCPDPRLTLLVLSHFPPWIDWYKENYPFENS